MLVFDTNIVIDVSNGRPEIQDLFEQTATIFISAVTWAEFMVGVKDAQWFQATRMLNMNYKIIHTDDLIMEHATRYRRKYRLKLMDAIIYATATSLGVPLVTRNTKDFDGSMPGVHIPYIIEE